MFNRRRFDGFADRLPLSAESDNFHVRYGMRNPQRGRGLGAQGVRWDWLVPLYLDSLEMAYERMAAYFGPDKPRTPANCKTLVLIGELSEFADGNPFTFDDPARGPMIVLPCRNQEPTHDGFVQRAVAEAVHETAHVFNFTSRPSTIRRNNDPWTWVDEATAVTLERLVLPMNPDCLRYAMRWTDEPETPLDAAGFWYASFPFMTHLVRRDPQFGRQLWKGASASRQRPFEILSSLMGGAGRPYDTPDPEFVEAMLDFFVTAYFSWEQTSWSFLPDVVSRYGTRNLTESFVLSGTNEVQASGDVSIDHLACRYFRVIPRAKHRGLTVKIEFTNRVDRPKLQVAVRPVNLDYPSPSFNRLVTPESTHDHTVSVSCAIEPSNVDGIDHYIVVVANCGVCADDGRPGTVHDDRRNFSLSVSLSD